MKPEGLFVSVCGVRKPFWTDPLSRPGLRPLDFRHLDLPKLNVQNQCPEQLTQIQTDQHARAGLAQIEIRKKKSTEHGCYDDD